MPTSSSLTVVLAALAGQAAALQMTARASAMPTRRGAVSMVATADSPMAEKIWETSPTLRVEGNTLKTWDIGSTDIERVQLSIRSEGRPIDANVELWHTPAYIPAKFRVYTMDGLHRPIDAIIETPKHPKTVAVYNIAEGEFPFNACVANTGKDKALASLKGEPCTKVQGANQVNSYTFGAEVESVQVLLSSAREGERNMKAKIEVTQGPNQVKQVIELYVSSGYKNPCYFVIQTPGASVHTLRVINQNTVEFPFEAWVLPYETSDLDGSAPVMGGM